MNDKLIPDSLIKWAETAADCNTKIDKLMRIYAEAVNCPRCFVYLRQPELKKANTTHAWWSEDRFAIGWESWYSYDWFDDGNAAVEDPMYGEAMVSPEPLYINDVEADTTGLVNAEFERKIFKHSALIHAPIYHAGKLYGILEPSAFDKPRVWSESDRAITKWTLERLGPIAAEYVATYGPK